MTPAGGAPSRVARTGAAAGVALAAAAGGHLGSGGAALSAPGLLAAAAALVAPAWWLTGRERGWGPLAGALLTGQLAAHALFTVTSPTGHAGMHLSPGHLSPEHHEVGWLPVDLMLLGHLLAAVVGAAWLRRGERRAWAAARRAAAALQQTLSVLLGRPVQVPADGGALRWDAREGHPTQQRAVLRHTIILRGPPLGG
ncbi:MAG: hypothetical protein ACRDUV_26405 [Pseudonocardiaceae bacterium]